MTKLLIPSLFTASSLGLFVAASLGGFAFAQESAPLDIDAIRANADEHKDDAQRLAQTVRERAKRLNDDARSVSADARANRERYAASLDPLQDARADEPFDFDEMIRGQAAAAKTGFGQAPRFIAFASLSMPPPSLTALVRDMRRAGGITVLRGFPGGSARELRVRLRTMAGDGGELSGLGIDPRLFRAFAIEAAPSFVMAGSDFDLCDGFDCLASVPPHDVMSGNVSVAHVLETFASGGGPGAALARLHLSRLEQDNDR